MRTTRRSSRWPSRCPRCTSRRTGGRPLPRRRLARGHPQLGPRLDLRLLGRRGRPGRDPPLRRGPHIAEGLIDRAVAALAAARRATCPSPSTPRLTLALGSCRSTWLRRTCPLARSCCAVVQLSGRCSLPTLPSPPSRLPSSSTCRGSRPSGSNESTLGEVLITVERQEDGTLVTPSIRAELAELRQRYAGEELRVQITTPPGVARAGTCRPTYPATAPATRAVRSPSRAFRQ